MSPWVVVLAWACSGGPVPAPADPRAALHEAERRVLAAEAERALAEGRELDAARVIGVERAWDEAVFGPLAARLAGKTSDPEVLARLGEIEPARLDAVRIERDYGPGLAATVAARSGARREHAAVVLEGVRREYLTAPDEAALLAAARARIGRLFASPAVQAAFPLGSPEVGEGMDGLIDGAIAAGLPEPIVVSEGVDAALAALDPFTRAVWPAGLSGWQEHHAGVVVGVGLDLVDAPDGGVVVLLPTPGGPAWSAGVHAGDGVLAVDGRGIEELPAPRAEGVLGWLRGAPGTPVRVALFRGGARQEAELARAEVPEETVTGWRRTDDAWETEPRPGVSVVRISAFRPHTDDELDAVLPEASKVILDLRGNGGGDVQAALNVADRFVASGELVRLEGRAVPPPVAGPNGEVPWNQAVPGHALEGVPVVVLVDGRTASAAEILAAALRDRAGAVIVGEPSFGKLVSQALRADPSGVAWQVTTARWVPASGPIERVVPDRVVAISPAERLAVDEHVRRREWPARHPDGSAVPYLGPVARSDLPAFDRDLQLEEALRALDQ